MPCYAFNFLQSEAGLAGSDFVKEHCLRTGPERRILVEAAIDDEFFPALGVAGEVFDDVIIAFVMLIDAVDDDFWLIHIFLSGGRGVEAADYLYLNMLWAGFSAGHEYF